MWLDFIDQSIGASCYISSNVLNEKSSESDSVLSVPQFTCVYPVTVRSENSDTEKLDTYKQRKNCIFISKGNMLLKNCPSYHLFSML